MKAVHIVGALAISVASSGIQAQNLLVNGNFQDSGGSGIPFIQNGETTPAFDSFYPENNLPGWYVGSGSVDVVYSYWTNPIGSNSLHLSGNFGASVFQSFATTVGQKYHVSFDLAGNPNGGSNVKTIMVQTSTETYQFPFDTSGKSNANMGWTTIGFDFMATGTRNTIQFVKREPLPYGPVIANVSVTAVPEPETYGMFLLGLGLMGAIAKSRRAKRTT